MLKRVKKIYSNCVVIRDNYNRVQVYQNKKLINEANDFTSIKTFIEDSLKSKSIELEYELDEIKVYASYKDNFVDIAVTNQGVEIYKGLMKFESIEELSKNISILMRYFKESHIGKKEAV